MRPITIHVSPEEFTYVKLQAEAFSSFCTPNNSHARDVSKRDDLKLQDCLVGKLGEYAFTVYLTGTIFPKDFCMSSWVATQRPKNRGDGGYDLPARRVDIKSRYMAFGDDLSTYFLPIRKGDRRPGWTYILAVVEKLKENLTAPDGVDVHLVGWATEDMFPAETGHKLCRHPRWGSAYILSASEIFPLPPMISDL